MDFKAYIRIIRLPACIIVASTALIGQILALGAFPDFFLSLKATLSGGLLSASSFVLNDYVDYAVDAINTPERPIPSGIMSRKEALWYGLFLGILGGFVTLLLKPQAALLGLAVYVLTIVYTLKAKVYGFIGNILVAVSIASYFVVGFLTVKPSIDPYIASVTGVCFFYVLGGEVIQSIADAEGDKLRGVKSISIVNGFYVAAIVASLCYVLMAVSGAYTALLFGFQRDSNSVILVFGTILVVTLITFPLLKNPNEESAIRTRNFVNKIASLILVVIILLLLV